MSQPFVMLMPDISTKNEPSIKSGDARELHSPPSTVKATTKEQGSSLGSAYQLEFAASTMVSTTYLGQRVRLDSTSAQGRERIGSNRTRTSVNIATHATCLGENT